jgi:GDP-L-fucose synthase
LKAAKSIYVAGHRGLVGSAIVRALRSAGYPEPITRSREELDLTDQRAVRDFIDAERPDAIFLAAAKVGGINANNKYRWDFIYENLAIEINVIGAAQEFNVPRLVFLGSSCVYPKLAPQPLREEALLTGLLEATNEPYAIAKIAGLKLVEAADSQFGRTWVSLMPTNLYGPQDNFDLQTSHVLPAMIRKFHEAAHRSGIGSEASVRLWGHGTALREFLHVEDLAKAALFVLEGDVTGLYNVGSGEEVSISALAEMIASVVGYNGRIDWDASFPDGTPRKLLDSSRLLGLGWKPEIGLRQGLASTYEWYLSTAGSVRR